MPISQLSSDHGTISTSTLDLDSEGPASSPAAELCVGPSKGTGRATATGDPGSEDAKLAGGCLERPSLLCALPDEALSLGVKGGLGGQRRQVQCPADIEGRDGRRLVVVVRHDLVLIGTAFPADGGWVTGERTLAFKTVTLVTWGAAEQGRRSSGAARATPTVWLATLPCSSTEASISAGGLRWRR